MKSIVLTEGGDVEMSRLNCKINSKVYFYDSHIDKQFVLHISTLQLEGHCLTAADDPPSNADDKQDYAPALNFIAQLNGHYQFLSAS